MLPETLDCTSISERDVDNLIVEELSCSSDFQTWLLTRFAENGLIKPGFTESKFEVQRGYCHSNGEVDILVRMTLEYEGRIVHIALLIENKINARFQPDQPERYADAAVASVDGESVDTALTMLLAPADYGVSEGDLSYFHDRITYEQIIEFLQRRSTDVAGELGDRLAYRASVLEKALEKSRRRYNMIPDEAVTSFWKSYYDLVMQHAPELRMKPPSSKPSNSFWVPFWSLEKRPPFLKQLYFCHQLVEGRICLMFYGWTKDFERTAAVVQPLLEPDMRLRQANEALAIDVVVPVLNHQQPLEPKTEAARQGFATALRVRNWYHTHIDALEQLGEKIATW